MANEVNPNKMNGFLVVAGATIVAAVVVLPLLDFLFAKFRTALPGVPAAA